MFRSPASIARHCLTRFTKIRFFVKKAGSNRYCFGLPSPAVLLLDWVDAGGWVPALLAHRWGKKARSCHGSSCSDWWQVEDFERRRNPPGWSTVRDVSPQKVIVDPDCDEKKELEDVRIKSSNREFAAKEKLLEKDPKPLARRTVHWRSRLEHWPNA